MSATNVWWWLEKNQKYIWAALYLAEIPCFGLAYSMMDRAFYSPNIKLERSYSNDAAQVADIICDLYNNRVEFKGIDLTDSSVLETEEHPSESQAEYAEEVKNVKGYKFSCNPPVGVSGPNDQRLIVDADMNDDAHQSLYLARIDVDLLTDGIASLSVYSEPFSEDSVAAYPVIGSRDYEVSSMIFEQRPSENVLEKLQRFTEGDSGFTSDVSDNLSRMIYFSAVTITTLGFGDIVPVTPMARWMVTAEAVSGVVLVGLFLNSLTRR